LLPKTNIKPNIATMTGNINGAPRRVIKMFRPIKSCRKKARDTGIANKTLIAAETKD
jgi:hypothetical protein